MQTVLEFYKIILLLDTENWLVRNLKKSIILCLLCFDIIVVKRSTMTAGASKQFFAMQVTKVKIQKISSCE